MILIICENQLYRLIIIGLKTKAMIFQNSEIIALVD